MDLEDAPQFALKKLRDAFVTIPGAVPWRGLPQLRERKRGKICRDGTRDPLPESKKPKLEAPIEVPWKTTDTTELDQTDESENQREPPLPGEHRLDYRRQRLVYSTLDDETPKKVASKFGAEVGQIVFDNKKRVPGLGSSSKLFERTVLFLPLTDTQVTEASITMDAGLMRNVKEETQEELMSTVLNREAAVDPAADAVDSTLKAALSESVSTAGDSAVTEAIVEAPQVSVSPKSENNESQCVSTTERTADTESLGADAQD